MKKVAFSSTGRDLNALLDPRFGRCDFFVIVDVETDDVEVFENEAKNASGGAGIQAAQFVANRGVDAVVSGNFGPNAFQTLQADGIEVISGISGTVEEVLKKFKAGGFQSVSGPNVSPHSGIKKKE